MLLRRSAGHALTRHLQSNRSGVCYRSLQELSFCRQSKCMTTRLKALIKDGHAVACRLGGWEISERLHAQNDFSTPARCMLLFLRNAGPRLTLPHGP
eukprot:772327-Pelagomonas_calceolata.AAC.6